MMRQALGRAGLWLALAHGGCDDATASVEPGSRDPDAPEPEPEPTTEAVPPHAEPPPPVVAPTIEPTAATDAWLRASSVDDEDYARRILYTWTTSRGATQMRRDKALFDDAVLPEGPTAYVLRLEHTASRDDIAGNLAKLLLGHPDLSRRRYAWVRPWATRLGMVRSYGDQLVEVVLKPDAIVGRYDASSPTPLSFRDLDGAAVPLAEVLATPRRIAAILHVSTAEAPHYREYVLCNPAMIERWSIATPELARVVDEDIAALRELAVAVDPPPEYEQARAFMIGHYDPAPEAFSAIADALAADVPAVPPTIVRPKVRFRSGLQPARIHVRRLPPRFVPVV